MVTVPLQLRDETLAILQRVANGRPVHDVVHEALALMECELKRAASSRFFSPPDDRSGTPPTTLSRFDDLQVEDWVDVLELLPSFLDVDSDEELLQVARTMREILAQRPVRVFVVDPSTGMPVPLPPSPDTERVVRYVVDGPDEQAAQHLDGCPSCHTEVESLRTDFDTSLPKNNEGETD